MTHGEPSDVRLDVSGHRCPLPALKARRRLAELEPGTILHLIATDPMAKIDIPHFCAEQGHELVADWTEGETLHFRIRKKMMPAFNEYSALKRVALRTPQAAFKDDARIDAEWKKLNYHSRPDLSGAVKEYDKFSDLLAKGGAELVTLPDAPGLTLDSLYVRDSLIVTPKGIVLAHMGKPARRAEPAANAAALGLPIAGEIKAPGMIEGGDLVWLDEKTLLVGIGYRTNTEAVRQLQAILPEVAIHSFDLPHFKGRSDVFHLMSVLSPLDADLACVYLPLMPVRLVELLESRNIAFAEVLQDEFDSMGCNVLAIAPRHVVMVSGNPGTAEAMRAKGCTVEILEANEISRKGEGGPTCLTRPLVRG